MNTFQVVVCAAVAVVTVCRAVAVPFSVKGQVSDSIGDPESYATVKIYSASDSVNPVMADLADTNGCFYFDLADPGFYNVGISAVGKETECIPVSLSNKSPVADLGTVILRDNALRLNEVTVLAQKPFVSKEIDRIGYDVQADEDAKASPLSDILKKVPLVMVQPDGTILVNGSSDYKIYRNGRPNASYSQNAKELFRAIPASSIKRIEVITDPGAREDAEGVGAILNIVTMEGSTLKGVSGTVSLNARSVEWYPYHGSAFLTTQIDKLTMSPYGGYFYSDRSSRSSQEGAYSYNNSGNRSVSSTCSDGSFHHAYWGFDSSLEIDTLNLITLEYSGNTYGGNVRSNTSTSLCDPHGALIYSYDTYSDNPGTSNLHNSIAANYQRSTRLNGETITLSYQFDLGNSDSPTHQVYSEMVNFPVAYDAIYGRAKSRTAEHTVQIDWSRPYGDFHKLDIGAKYINRYSRSKSEMEYVGAHTDHRDFSYLRWPPRMPIGGRI